MTVGELKQRLVGMPDNMQVFVKNDSDFAYGLARDADVKKIQFGEQPDGEPMASDTVFVVEGN